MIGSNHIGRARGRCLAAFVHPRGRTARDSCKRLVIDWIRVSTARIQSTNGVGNWCNSETSSNDPMDLTLNKRGWLSLAVLGASLVSIPEANVFGDTTAYGIFKTESFFQSASAGANPLSGFPYTFVVQGSGTGSLTLPSGTKISLPQAGVSTNN